MQITVIGCGYLGAVHAACMASIGHDVIGIDTDPTRLHALSQGVSPFHEPHFDELLRSQVDSGRLRFTDRLGPEEVQGTDVHFVAVGTPQSKDSDAADLTYVWSAVESLVDVNPRGAVVVGKSTVPVGTAAAIAERLAHVDATLVWNPEFLREGHAINDTLHPDRIVYGLPSDPQAAAQASATLDRVYAPLIEEGIPLLRTDYATAELVKVAANAFLATKISFINAMGEICEKTGADVSVLADAIGHDARIGRRFLGAGIGFGGGCLPKDIRAFAARAEQIGSGASVAFLREMDAINKRRRMRVLELVEQMCASAGIEMRGARVAILGAAFKPNSDDIRDSPALEIAERLYDEGVDVVITDPCALPSVRRLHPRISVNEDMTETLRGADLVIVATEWAQYRDLDPAEVVKLVRNPQIIDGRNILNMDMWKQAGWNIRGIGR